MVFDGWMGGGACRGTTRMGERIERVVGLVSDTALGRFGHRPYTRVRILTYPSSSLRRFLPSWWISKYYRTMNSIMILCNDEGPQQRSWTLRGLLSTWE